MECPFPTTTTWRGSSGSPPWSPHSFSYKALAEATLAKEPLPRLLNTPMMPKPT